MKREEGKAIAGSAVTYPGSFPERTSNPGLLARSIDQRRKSRRTLEPKLPRASQRSYDSGCAMAPLNEPFFSDRRWVGAQRPVRAHIVSNRARSQCVRSSSDDGFSPLVG